MSANTTTTSDMLDALYASNSCGYSKADWVAMHKSIGYTFGTKPADYDTARLGDCMPEVATFADKAAAGKTRGLVITGETGRGKTYTACAIARHVSETHSVGILTDAQILEACKDTFGARTSEREVIERICAPYLLVIDDLGKAAYTDWALQTIFSCIDRRGHKPLIVTTQYNASGLKTKLTCNGSSSTAEAILSRFRAFDKLHLEGMDRR